MAVPASWPQEESGGDVFFQNESGNAETFEAYSSRMFTNDELFNVEACFIDSSGSKPKRIENIKEVEVFMNETELQRLAYKDASEPSTRILIIHQKHTRSEMQISKAAMTLILSRLHVLANFVNILSAFTLQINESSTSITGFSSFYGRNHSVRSFETAYILKYIDLSGRSGTDPWSIRQMAIYQHFDASTFHSENLLIRASHQVQKGISNLVHSRSADGLRTHWTNIHSVYLGTLSHNWGSYISWIDTVISQVDFNYFFAKVDGEQPNRLRFEDLQLLNKGIDALSQMAQSLALNVEVLTLLSQEAARRAVIEGDSNDERYEAFQQDIRTSLAEHSFFSRHVRLLQTFANRRSVQLRDAIALQDSNVMMGISQKTFQEAQTMRTLTIVALFYLPASFTATFLSMGFIHVENLGGLMKLNVTQDIWFYLAVTVPLMVFTFLAYAIWEGVIRRRARMRITNKQSNL